MIYNIHGFQHAKLLEFGLDNDDALILRAITGMYASPKMEYTTINGVRYIWVNQSYLQRQVKVIGSKRTVMRRVNKMIEKGILSSHTLYSKKEVKGTYYYIAPTEKLDRLRDIEPYDNMSKGQAEPYDNMSKGGRSNCPTKDTINNKDYNKYIISSTQTQNLTKADKEKIISEWNNLGLQQLRGINNNTKRYKMLKSRIDEFSLDEVLEAIDEISQSQFLQGNNERGWTITFDWLVRPNNFIKVLEGTYRDKQEVTKNEGDSKEDDFDFGISI